MSVREQVSFSRLPALSLCCSSGLEEAADHPRGSLVTVLLIWHGGGSRSSTGQPCHRVAHLAWGRQQIMHEAALSPCCSSGVGEAADHARGSLVTVLLVWRGGGSRFTSFSLPDCSFSSQMMFGLSSTNTERHADSRIKLGGSMQ